MVKNLLEDSCVLSKERWVNWGDRLDFSVREVGAASNKSITLEARLVTERFVGNGVSF